MDVICFGFGGALFGAMPCRRFRGALVGDRIGLVFLLLWLEVGVFLVLLVPQLD